MENNKRLNILCVILLLVIIAGKVDISVVRKYISNQESQTIPKTVIKSTRSIASEQAPTVNEDDNTSLITSPPVNPQMQKGNDITGEDFPEAPPVPDQIDPVVVCETSDPMECEVCHSNESSNCQFERDEFILKVEESFFYKNQHLFPRKEVIETYLNARRQILSDSANGIESSPSPNFNQEQELIHQANRDIINAYTAYKQELGESLVEESTSPMDLYKFIRQDFIDNNKPHPIQCITKKSNCSYPRGEIPASELDHYKSKGLFN